MKKNWKPKSTRMEKIKWLHINFELWSGYPNNTYIDSRHDNIVNLMRKDGLISDKTRNYDVNLHSLISDVRRLRREKNI